MNPPDTAVIIATAGRGPLLRRTLESLIDAAHSASLVELRVVENGGRRGAETVLEKVSSRFPVQYMYREEGNKARALNAAVEACRGEFICFFDDDVEVEEGNLRAYIDAAQRYGAGHHFAGPLFPDWEAEPPEWLKPYLPPSVTGWYHGGEERFYDEPHFIGSNWAAFRADVLHVGGFLPLVGPGSASGTVGDEMEIQRRLLDAGGRGVYVPAAVARHQVERSACDFEWARVRQRRTGRTYGILGWPMEGPERAGRPGWGRVGLLAAKVLVARTLRWSPERRAHLEMTLARSHGYLEGRAMRRRELRAAGGDERATLTVKPRR